MLNKFLKGDRTPVYSDNLTNQLALTCRLIVGGYLLYLAYGLVESAINADEMFRLVMFAAAIVCFVLAGGYFAYSSARDLLIGRYVGGKLDLGERPVEAEVPTEENTDVVEEIKEDTQSESNN